MIEHHSKHEGVHPALIALLIAIFGILAMLLVDHGPWSHPHAQPAHVAYYRTTGEATRAAGAALAPTEPKTPLEPEAPGPKPAQPPNPEPE